MSDTTKVPEPLGDFLKSFCNVNAPSIDLLARYIRNTETTERTQTFRQQLHDAITNNTITPSQYEALTDEDFDSQEALNKWLKELWSELYGDEFTS